jgi:hypothetical protein
MDTTNTPTAPVATKTVKASKLVPGMIFRCLDAISRQPTGPWRFALAVQQARHRGYLVLVTCEPTDLVSRGMAHGTPGKQTSASLNRTSEIEVDLRSVAGGRV